MNPYANSVTPIAPLLEHITLGKRIRIIHQPVAHIRLAASVPLLLSFAASRRKTHGQMQTSLHWDTVAIAQPHAIQDMILPVRFLSEYSGLLPVFRRETRAVEQLTRADAHGLPCFWIVLPYVRIPHGCFAKGYSVDDAVNQLVCIAVSSSLSQQPEVFIILQAPS